MPEKPERITFKKIGAQILEQLNLERGLGYTIKQFAVRPKQALDQYLYEDRRIFMKPFSFLLLTSAITTFLMIELMISQSQEINEITKMEGWEQIPDFLKPGLVLLSNWIGKYFNLFYLSTLPTVALASYWVFKKKAPYNLAEHLILNTYIFGIQSIIYIFNIPFISKGEPSFWLLIPSLLITVYFVFAYKRIFALSFWQSIGYALVVYLIAQLLISLALGVIVLGVSLFS